MLTEIQLRKTKPAEKGIKKLYDTGGLFLAVMPTGSKLWRMRFKKDGKELLLSFGPYPEVGLVKARELRDQAREKLRAGVVPAGRIRAAQGEKPADTPPRTQTFEEVARRWHKQQTPRWKRGHADDVLESLEVDVFPAVGKLPIKSITSPEVLQIIRAIEPRSVDTARRVRQRMSAIFCFAIAEGLAENDPSAPILKAIAPQIKGQRQAIIDLEPARAMLRTAEASPSHPITKLAHRLLALTAVRPGEVRLAAWHEFEGLDGPNPLWRIPAARMKMKREHLVPLAPAAVEVLRTAAVFSGNLPIVFPSTRNERKPISENAIGFFLNRAGFKGLHVPHGWRATFSSVMNERNRADRAVVELMLAHTPADRVEAAYNRALHLERRRQISIEWAELILDGAAPAGEVVEGVRR